MYFKDHKKNYNNKSYEESLIHDESEPLPREVILRSSSRSVDLDILLPPVNSLNSSKVNSRSETLDSKKPPLPKNGLPKFKLDHPTSLPTQTVNTPASTKTSPSGHSSGVPSPSLSARKSNCPTPTQFYISNSVQGSPATTPNFGGPS